MPLSEVHHGAYNVQRTEAEDCVAISDRVCDVFKLQPKSKIETSTLPKVKEESIILQQYDLFTRIATLFTQCL
jgi:hypothetical protein